MASWNRIDTDIYRDGDFAALWQENPGFPWIFTALVAIAKAAADVDPDAWQGHLVTPSGRALSEAELSRLVPQFPRAHQKQMAEFFSLARGLGLICAVPLHECDATATEPKHDGDKIAHEVGTKSAQFVLQITDWFRWWQKPEKAAKSSTARSRRHREKKALAAAQRVACNGATPPTDKTDITVQTDPPNPPGAEGDFLDAEFTDPESLPPDPRGQERASDDPTKFSSLLTREQALALRSKTLQEFQHLAAGGLARAQMIRVCGYLEAMPPVKWPHGPRRWADCLFHFATKAIKDVQHEMATKKNHGIGNPSAVAIGKAQTYCAEFQAEAAVGARR